MDKKLNNIDPIKGLADLFVNNIQKNRIYAGQCPARRPVFLKFHGAAKGTFTINPELPAGLRVGIFSGHEFPAWVRFSSDTIPLLTDARQTLGIAIKLFNVCGEKTLPEEEGSETQDFILQNHPVFFVNNAKEMYDFTYAGVQLHDYNLYLKDHPDTARILGDMEHDIPDILQSSFWSILPHRFGDGRYVKYIIRPQTERPSLPIPPDNPGYLADRLKDGLLNGPVKFNFFIQLRTDPGAMPLDEAMVPWSETISRPLPAATLALDMQDISKPGQSAYGENLSFNPWRSLPVHEPVGSISEARKVVYKLSADQRRQYNGIPIIEPTKPGPY